MSKIMSFLILFLIIGGFSGFNVFAQSKTDTNTVEVNIEGLSCPFCAYGLEKKIKEIDGAKNVKIDVKKGLMTFSLNKGKSVSEKEINKIVRDAGFTPKYIKLLGKIVQKKKDEKKKNEDYP